MTESPPILHSLVPSARCVPLPNPMPTNRQGKIYADLPHRYFSSVDALKAYVIELKRLGVNVLLLLPHFLPSFSEYVVKDYERPCPLFGTWEVFADFMKFTADLGIDRMIDIPFNHADWQAEHLQRDWFVKKGGAGIEAGADDCDADGRRVRINWGAFILDNGNRDLQDYWLHKVIFPHIEKYHVNAIRIDAAWGLDAGGLTRIVGETKRRYPHVWFLAENLGMDKLINLARSGIDAGADRFFNNFYWYGGGWSIPIDIYRFWKQGGAKPSCTLFSSHDVITPALKALATEQAGELGELNDKALVREIMDRRRLRSLLDLAPTSRARVLHRMHLDFLLAALASTDTMFVAGSELGLLERVNVLTSIPGDFATGVPSTLPEFMRLTLAGKAALPMLASEGVLIPFGAWQRAEQGIKGFVRRTGGQHLVVAVNTDLDRGAVLPVPQKIRQAAHLVEVGAAGLRHFRGADLPITPEIPPGTGIVLYSTPEGTQC
jgi:hypothetical protein